MFKSKALTYLTFLFLISTTALAVFWARSAQQEVITHLNTRNNLWSHYSSKSLKGKLYEIEKNRLALTAQLTTLDPGKSALLTSLIGNLDREIERYRKEQADIQAEAVRHDNAFELAKRQGVIFDLAALILAVSCLSFVAAVALSADNLLTKFVTGLLALAGGFLLVYGFWFT